MKNIVSQLLREKQTQRKLSQTLSVDKWAGKRGSLEDSEYEQGSNEGEWDCDPTTLTAYPKTYSKLSQVYIE